MIRVGGSRRNRGGGGDDRKRNGGIRGPRAGEDAAYFGSGWYIENSPFFYLDRVHTPLLILHGSADRSVLVFHGGQVFSALRRLGREVEFRKYDGEGHVLEGRENIVDYWNAVIRWFDGHVKNAAPTGKR